MIYKCKCGHSKFLSYYKGKYYCAQCKQDQIDNEEEAHHERIAIVWEGK